MREWVETTGKLHLCSALAPEGIPSGSTAESAFQEDSERHTMPDKFCFLLSAIAHAAF
jgi:hypothetical protein